MDSAVTLSTSPEGISILTLNRRQKRNAVNDEVAIQLRDAFLAFEGDETQKVCVFHGANGTFCSGFDLQDLSHTDAASYAPQAGPVTSRNLGPMGPSRMTIKKPVICAVAGHAVAGGLELSLLGDMRIVEEDAVFGVFCRRFGVPLIDGGTVRLQRIIGLGRAMDMILTGRAVGAQEALTMGLANRVVPKGKALDEAVALAKLLAAFPQTCLNADRMSVYHAAYEAKSLDDALAFEYDNGIGVVNAEGVLGAKKFAGGKGRNGQL